MSRKQTRSDEVAEIEEQIIDLLRRGADMNEQLLGLVTQYRRLRRSRLSQEMVTYCRALASASRSVPSVVGA